MQGLFFDQDDRFEFEFFIACPLKELKLLTGNEQIVIASDYKLIGIEFDKAFYQYTGHSEMLFDKKEQERLIKINKHLAFAYRERKSQAHPT